MQSTEEGDALGRYLEARVIPGGSGERGGSGGEV
jgi:hypothetical protein